MENNSSEITFIDPQLVVAQLDLPQGIGVADFGCGAGYFSLPIAQKIGAEGHVYSFDILPQKIEALESQIKTQGVSNITPRRANLEKVGGSKLADESVDWVIMKDMLFQNKNKQVILEEARRILKTGGNAVVIEWKTGDTQIGPEQALRISQENLKQVAGLAGWQVAREISVGDLHYGIILAKTNDK